MSVENIKVVDGVIRLTEHDPSSLTSLSANQSYLHAADDGAGTTIPALATTSGTGYLIPSDSKSGIVLTDASGVQWEVSISTSGTFSATSGTW